MSDNLTSCSVLNRRHLEQIEDGAAEVFREDRSSVYTMRAELACEMARMALAYLDAHPQLEAMKQAINDAEAVCEERGRPEGEYLADSIKALLAATKPVEGK